MSADQLPRKRSGISSARAYRLQSEAQEKIKGIFSYTIHFKTTLDEMSDKVREVMTALAKTKAPGSICSYLHGYMQARRDELYQYHLVWVLSLDGKLVTSADVDRITNREAHHGLDDAIDYQSPWSRINGDLSRHVWRDGPNGPPLYDKPVDARFLKEKV